MRRSDLSRYALGACAALLILTGCGWSVPLGVPNDLRVGTSSTAEAPKREQSWMAPEAAKQNLLYVDDDHDNAVKVYSYLPAKPKLMGRLFPIHAPQGECVDSAGNVWIAHAYDVVEYAHGGTKPIAEVNLRGYLPVSCAVDPKTGNLAVTYGWLPSCYSGNSYLDCPFTYLAIYGHAQGKPILHRSAKKRHFDFCSYDNRGDLFVGSYYDAGSSSLPDFRLGEIPYGSNKLVTLTLDPPFKPFNFVNGIQWHDVYLTIAFPDPFNSVVYRYRISGHTAKRVGATTLNRSGEVYEFWTAGTTIVAGGFHLHGGVRYYDYPRGGKPTTTITGISFPFGVAVSLAK